jgi:subtilisin-like proprotein convertase family protein
MTAVLVATRGGSAATPTSGTISEAAPVLTYDAGPFTTPNQSPLGLGQLDQGPRCNGNTFPCDNFALTVTLPSGYLAAHPNASVKVTMYWTDLGAQQSDYDLYIYRGVVGDLNGSRQADYQAASGANPEVGSITPLADGTTQYSLKIVPYVSTLETVHVRMELLTGSGGGGFPGFGGPDPTIAGAPRYQTFVAPAGSTAETSNGEFNIGFNPTSGRIMAMNSGPIWRLTPAERLAQAKPECCEALWEDVSAPSTIVGVDPILWTDQKTGRTLASNSTAGTNGVYAFSDDDGDLWNPISASPPNASTDHETIGSGPYPASLSSQSNALNHGQAVYYCAQTWPVGAAACQRSDTLGLSYGPSVLPYTGNNGDPCGGIHGHVRVGPDGTVYLPVRDCSGNAGVVTSTDGGASWVEHIIPNSKTQTHGSDPSVAIGANNTVYFFYVADQTTSPVDPTEGHIHVQISTDHCLNWAKDTDLGTTHGVKNAVFPEAIAGDDNRVAVGFLGTDRPGDFEGASFPGIWYLFIATTYDNGDHWTIVNATPNDPVQGAGGIWLGGGSNHNRNLLDFNEVTVDDKGRVIFGYSDGCVGDCIGNPSNNSYTANMRVARQFGGNGLFASKDLAEPTAAKPACLSGTRDSSGSKLSWKTPDNGGADIVNYEILRGTTPGTEIAIGQTVGPKNTYSDTTADPSVTRYYYVVKAINSSGTGNPSNEVELTVTATPTPTPMPTPAPCGSATSYPNLAGIQTNDNSAGSPYPSQINVAGLSGTVTKITVNLNDITHNYPDDIDILLVGPGGQNAVIMSDVGGNVPANAVSLTLDDAATAALLDNGPLVSGTFKPNNVGTADAFPAPAPTTSGGSALSVFNGSDPNGAWSLYVLDDEAIDRGSLSGWSLSITTNCGGPTPTPTPTPTATPTPNGNICVSTPTQVATDSAGDQGATNPSQLDVRAVSVSEDYSYINSERLVFTVKVDNLTTVPANGIWRARWRFTPAGGADTTYYVSALSDANSRMSYEYGTISGNLITPVGSVDSGSYSSDGTITMAIAMAKVGNPTAGSVLKTVQAVTQQNVQGTLFTGVDSSPTSGDNPSYTVAAKNAACTPVPLPPPPGTATYVKGGMTFSPNYALRASTASRDGEPSLRVDKFGNAYVAGIRGVPAGVDLWYFDLNPNSPTYDPYMRNPIYRGQPDQFSPDESMELGADGGGDVDLAVGFDESSPNNPPYLAFSSLVAANISTARSTDRGVTFVKNPAGNVTGGVPADDRQWMEFYGKDTVYMLYRTLAPAVTQIQRSIDGGLTYGPTRTAGLIGQVGGIDVDQNDGTVYISGNQGVVAVGIPAAPGLEPLTYTVYNVTGSGKANIFFTVKVAKDSTAYVCYSDGKNIYIQYTKDKGKNWGLPVRISDGPETATSLLPWLETGPTPGSIGVVWYGTTASSNSNDANWQAFFAQSADITSAAPTVRQTVVSDHFIHGSNISLSGLPLDPTAPSGNRNLIDYFQIGFDPTGAAVIAFTDDHNDFDGHTYVARQVSGPSVNGGTIPAPVEGSGLPAPAPAGPKPSAESVGGISGSQVTDFRHDVRTSNAALDVDDPFDILSIKYSTEGTASDPVLVATMKVSGVSAVPVPNGTWRINFTANAPGAQVSATGDYNLGLSDRGDQFFLRAATDPLGSQTFIYGTTSRRHFVAGGGGGFDYVDKGTADSGSINPTTGIITIKASLSKLNAALASGHTPLGPGSILAGLRGSAFAAVQGNNARSDSTRGGTQYAINSAPTAALSANPTSGTSPLNVNFDGSGSNDPDGDTLSYTFNFGDGSSPVTQSNPKIAHTYNQVGSYTASLKVKDSAGWESNAATVGITVNAPPPPVVVCYDDDDAHIAYSSGWHLINSPGASGGHFRLHQGKQSGHFASLTFDVPAGYTGALTYSYAKSTKGGSAEVFIDGAPRGVINYNGPTGGMKDPQFSSGGMSYAVKYVGLAPGQHKFELRNLTDSVYVDGFCLESSSSSSQPAAGPGQTAVSSSSIAGGQQSSSSMSIAPGTTEIAVLAEASGGLPIKLVLVDPAGITLQIVDATNGVAVLNAPVTQGGIYTIKVVNVSLGPVQVWTAATPLVTR